MRIRTMAWFLGGAVAVAASGIGAIACSSDNGTGNPTTPTKDATATDSNTPTHDSSTGGNDGGVNNPDTSTGDDAGATDAAVDCGKTLSLHPVDAGTGPYCPFSAVGDAGNLTCAFGQHCCENPASANSPSTCAANCNSMADGGTEWECQGAANCPTGSVCCAITTAVKQDPGCPGRYLSKFNGTTCRTSCQSGEVPMCETQGECLPVDGGPTTCNVAKAKGAEFGVCTP